MREEVQGRPKAQAERDCRSEHIFTRIKIAMNFLINIGTPQIVRKQKEGVILSGPKAPAPARVAGSIMLLPVMVLQ